jgi:hypothetical protein
MLLQWITRTRFCIALCALGICFEMVFAKFNVSSNDNVRFTSLFASGLFTDVTGYPSV